MSTVLVTGAKGCIGAWALRALLDGGHQAVALDLPGNMHRLQLILGDDLPRVRLMDGDILDADGLARTVKEQGITHILHLAAFQVPLARAKPTLGAQVNVVGTVNVFEAARAAGIQHLAYASSIAVYNADRQVEPGTLYGVWKLANEGTARVYYSENGISSIALRPYVVYGLGRDFGMTSSPTVAMLAAAAGQSSHIPFANAMLYQTGRDIGALFVRAALASDFNGAAVYDPPGTLANTREIVEAIHNVLPDANVTFDDVALPFPTEFNTEALAEVIGPVQMTPLNEGVRETIEGFRAALAKGLIAPPAKP